MNANFSAILKKIDYGFRFFLSILGGDSNPSYHEDDHELA